MADINIGPTKAEDSPHASGDQGVMALGVRNDAGAPLAADGDYIPLTTDSTGALRTTATGAASVAVTSVVPGIGATNLGKAEDSPHTSADVGIMPLAVRNDAGAALAADGDYIPLSTDSTGALRTTSTGGASGTEYDEDTPHVSGDKVTMAGVVQQTADAALSANGDRSLLQVDANGFLKVNVKTGGSAVDLGKVEDTPHSSGDTGVMLLGVRNETGTSLSDTAGDYTPLSVNASGHLLTTEITGDGVVDDMSPFIEGAVRSTPIAGVVNDVIGSDPGEDSTAIVRITPKRAWHSNLRNNAGTEVGTAAAPLRVDPTGTTTQPVSMAAAPAGSATAANQVIEIASLQEIDNIVHAAGEALNEFAVIGGQLDDVGTVTPTEGQVGASRITSGRGLHVNLRSAAGSEISPATLAEQQTQTASLSVIDDWDESDRAKVNPIAGQAGVQGGSGTVTALTQRVVLATDVVPTVTDAVLAATSIRKTLDWSGAITASTLWDPAAGLRFVLTDLVLSCSGASIVTIFEDTDTTTNRIAKVSIAANGGFTMNYRKPIPGAVDNILKVTVTGAGAVGFITVSGYEV